MDRVDTALLALRLVVGLTLVAHGLNHLYGGGRIPGAARWFESLGLRPGVLHAWLSTLTELAAGIGIAAGFLTSMACGAAVGLMVVAGIAGRHELAAEGRHRRLQLSNPASPRSGSDACHRRL